MFALSRGNTTGPAYAAAAAQLLEFDADGNYLREIGHNLYAWSFAHMAKVDRHDNIWVHRQGLGHDYQVYARRTGGDGVRAQTRSLRRGNGPLKHPKPPLAAEPGRFRQVTDVAFDTADNTHSSDGYINSRVAKVDKNGNWIKSWGERGSRPGQFSTPHAIAVGCQRQHLCRRPWQSIQVFDSEGNFLRQMIIDVPMPPNAKPAIGDIPSEAQLAGVTFAPGSPWLICITRGPNQVLYSADAWPGRYTS